MRAGRLLAAGAAAITLVGLGAGCSKNTGQNDNQAKPIKKVTSGIATDPAQSKGPAAPIPGAKRGGTLYTLQEADFDHLDPQRVYVSDATALDQMLCRTLTMFKQDPKTGKNLLVGDLATNTGVDVNHDGKTWRYTLKKGLKYEDGTPITAKDVAYGVARSFSPNIADGPHYINKWLTGKIAYNKTYKGPYNGGSDMPPGVTVKGNTITFHLKSSEPDFPYAASWGITTPIPKAQDKSPNKIDTHPFSSGPYKIQSYQRGNKLIAVRNKYWDPKTDPVRHNYFDKLVVKIGDSAANETERMLADQGDDQYAVQLDSVPPELTAKVLADKSVKPREIVGFLPYAERMDINTQRVKDVSIRKALNYAFNKAAYLKAEGGPSQGKISSEIMSPTVNGFKEYNAYPSPGDTGDVAKAKKLLHGRHPHLVLGYVSKAASEKIAVTIKNGLERAGFKITIKPIDKDNYFTLIERKDNPYDLYRTNWGADWPSGSTVIPPLFGGKSILPNGGTNTAFFNEPDVNAKIAKISKMPAQQAASKWGDLDEYIMTKYAPCVPTIDLKQLSLMGSKVHGVMLGAGNVGSPIYYDAWVG